MFRPKTAHAFPALRQKGRDLCKIPLFTFSLTAETQTQVFVYFRS